MTRRYLRLAQHILAHPVLRPRILPLRYASQIRPAAESPSQATNTPWKRDGANDPPFLQASNFAGDASVILSSVKRFFKWTFVGVAALSVIVGTSFELAHQWVEYREMAPETDKETRLWGWAREGGGTDPALGFIARHAVRAAWMAQNWGIGSTTAVIQSNAAPTERDPTGGGLVVVDARLAHADQYLRAAIAIAENRFTAGKLRPSTLMELLMRHADVLEEIGTAQALLEAKSHVQRVWTMLPPPLGVEAAQSALRLGNLVYRLGESEESVLWWRRAVNISRGVDDNVPITSPPAVPETTLSPLAQRVLASTLLSLSMHFARTGLLQQAQEAQETSLSTLGSILGRPPPADATPPRVLHYLYVLHWSSVISLQLAEVLYARHEPVSVSSDYLRSAATSTERIAFTLCGLLASGPDTPSSQTAYPPAPDAPLLPAYAASIHMSRPASDLLRDAKRTAVEAWNLLGVLGEKKDPARALECYERALGWAGVGADGPEAPGDEWKGLWGNYLRARDAMRKMGPSK